MPLLLAGALYLCGHLLLDWLSFVHPYGSLGITPWNPSTGLSFVLVLLLGWRTLPFMCAGFVLANLVVRPAILPPPLAITEALTAAAGYSAVLLALLHPRLRFNPSLPSARDLFLLMAAAMVGSALVASMSVAILNVAGLLGDQEAARAALRYWVGDMIGIAVVTPFGLLTLTRQQLLRRGWETMLLVGASFVLALWVVEIFAESHELQLFYLLFLPVTWIAVRSGLEGVSTALVFIQLGLFIQFQFFPARSIDVMDVQARMLILALTGLVAGALVTERRRTEVRLRMNQDALAHVSRLGSMGELAAAIAHEINQPLSAAGTYTGLVVESLQAEALRDPTTIETAQKAAEQVDRAAEVVRRLRTLVRLGRSDVTPTPIARIVEETIELARPDLERRNIALEAEIAGGLPRVMADRLQIEQVLLNLVRNSADAILAAEHRRGQITIRAAKNGPGFVELSVSDTGPGFPPAMAVDDLPPFSTTKADGLGVGLSLCRSIAKAHGGELQIRSDRVGATVAISLPTAETSRHG